MRPYFTEDEKMAYSPFPKWTFGECLKISEILHEKGYIINCVSRVGCDRRYHDAWQVPRKDVPQLVEQLFRQRITVEVQAEGKGMAAITFVYDYAASTIIESVRRFQKNKEAQL